MSAGTDERLATLTARLSKAEIEGSGASSGSQPTVMHAAHLTQIAASAQLSAIAGSGATDPMRVAAIQSWEQTAQVIF